MLDPCSAFSALHELVAYSGCRLTPKPWPKSRGSGHKIRCVEAGYVGVHRELISCARPQFLRRGCYVKRREFIALVSGAAVWPLVGVSEGSSAHGSELLMFERPDCVWCKRWDAEIAPAYSRTIEGSRAPLRRIHVRDQAIAGVLLEPPVTVTPTFVLAYDGREIGRILGHPGNEVFYGLLGELLKRLPR